MSGTLKGTLDPRIRAFNFEESTPADMEIESSTEKSHAQGIETPVPSKSSLQIHGILVFDLNLF